MTILYFAIVASKMAVRTCLCIKILSRGSLCKGVFGGRVSDKNILQGLSNTDFAIIGFNHAEN